MSIDELARLDWSRAGTGDPLPCVLECGENAILRHPTTGRPCHKVCSDQRRAALIERTAATAGTHPGRGRNHGRAAQLGEAA